MPAKKTPAKKTPATNLNPEQAAMLEAHVQFELSRWNGERLGTTVAEEVDELFEWLASVPLADLVSDDQVIDWVERYVCQTPITDEVVDMVVGVVRSAHAAARKDKTPVSELLPRDVYDQLARTAIGMKELRHAVTDQITTNEAYSRLISHVMYHGIKNYLLTESVIARKVPGASSLMRLGQSALSTAAPKLEKGIDRQLTSFVNSNIQDSIRESRDFLNTVLDKELLTEVATEVWNTNADSTIADATGLTPAKSLDGLVGSGLAVWLHVRTTSTFRVLLTRVVADFLAEHGKRPIADLLSDAGITVELVSQGLAEAVTPALARGVRDGYVEGRIRARLTEFYSSYIPSVG